MKAMKIVRSVLALLLVLSMVLAVFASCGQTPSDNGGNNNGGNNGNNNGGNNGGNTGGNGDNTDDPAAVRITVTAPVSEIRKGETVLLTVTVENATNTEYTWSVSRDDILAVENDTVSVIGDITIDTIVSVTATSVEDPTRSASKTFIVRAPIVDGRVGELTSEMIAALGNASITVQGTLTDYYTDYKQSSNSSVYIYDMAVKMADGAWHGVWNIRGQEESAVSYDYRRGETDGVKDQYGNIGHANEMLFINKNNQLTRQVVKDYMSIPAVWEAQHLWNHLGNLNVNKFVYNPEQDRYEYQISTEEDRYLMTYLSFSLTPMLEDTLAGMYLEVEDGKIVRLVGETEKMLYGDDPENAPDALSYTGIEVTFSDIGTTVVEAPAPYDAPENAEFLTAALEAMKNARNYTFRTKDVQTYAPSGDPGDYTVDSIGIPSGGSVRNLPYGDNASSVGTVGCVGYVTGGAVLFQDTMKYSYSMDDKLYRTTYTGYKDNGDGTYDVFAYAAATGDVPAHFYGTKRVSGSFFDAMPGFDFSANLFEFVSSKRVGGVTHYTFQLRETAITRDIALEVSAYKYADDAMASTGVPTTIVVDENGNLISTTFPYDLVSGTYTGYCTTTYSEVGTTELAEGTFDGYVRREVKTSWSQYELDDYYYLHTTLCAAYGCAHKDASGNTVYDHSAHTATMEQVLRAIFGDSYDDVPSPEVLMEIFGDEISGPFFDWREKGTDGDGNTIYADSVDIVTESDEYDENSHITNYPQIIEELTKKLGALGFTISQANTDTSGGANGTSTRYVTFIKGDVQIVVENNSSRYFWIHFYRTGDWTLNK